MDSYDDAGPLLDVVLYKEDGEDGVWRAVVDTGGMGDLTAASPMAPYRHERQVSELGFGTELSALARRTTHLTTDLTTELALSCGR